VSFPSVVRGGIGYSLSSSSFSINQDDKDRITSTSNTFPDTLSISSGGISKSVDLSFIVTPQGGDISTKEELAAIAGKLDGNYAFVFSGWDDYMTKRFRNCDPEALQKSMETADGVRRRLLF
jgi:hypothetical protein